MNNCVIIGRTVREVELKYLQNGTANARLTVAVDRGLSKEKKQEMESKGQNTADFINVTLWGKTAEFAANYLGKGKMVAVQGRIQTGNYDDKDGKKIYTTEVVASNIEVLEWKNKEEGIPDGFGAVDTGNIPF